MTDRQLSEDVAQWCRDEVVQAIFDVASIEKGCRYLVRRPDGSEGDMTDYFRAARQRSMDVLRDLLASYGLSEAPPDLQHGGPIRHGD